MTSRAETATRQIEIASLGDMRTLADAVAGIIRSGDVVCLDGDLGSGKTTFARFFLQALGVRGEVPSPTFNLVLVYDTTVGEVWHFDLYRLTGAEEAYELGIEDAFADAISLIEWPVRLGGLLPADRLDILIEAPGDDDGRLVTLTGRGAFAGRIADIAA